MVNHDTTSNDIISSTTPVDVDTHEHDTNEVHTQDDPSEYRPVSRFSEGDTGQEDDELEKGLYLARRYVWMQHVAESESQEVGWQSEQIQHDFLSTVDIEDDTRELDARQVEEEDECACVSQHGTVEI